MVWVIFYEGLDLINGPPPCLFQLLVHMDFRMGHVVDARLFLAFHPGSIETHNILVLYLQASTRYGILACEKEWDKGGGRFPVKP